MRLRSEYLIISAEKLCLLRCQRFFSLLLSLDGLLGGGLLGDLLDGFLGDLLDDLLGGGLLGDLLHGLLGGGGLLGDFLGGGGFLGDGSCYKRKIISKLKNNFNPITESN